MSDHFHVAGIKVHPVAAERENPRTIRNDRGGLLVCADTPNFEPGDGRGKMLANGQSLTVADRVWLRAYSEKPADQVAVSVE